MTRKLRSDAKVFVLLQLPHHQQDQLSAWLLEEGISYKKALERVRDDFGVVATKGAIETFWSEVCSPLQFSRLARAADALPETTGGLEANWQASSRAYVRQKYFQLLASRDPNPKEVGMFAKQIAAMDVADLKVSTLRFNRQKAAMSFRLKRRDQALSQAKFDALERRNAEAREKLNAMVESKGGLTPETIAQIEEALRLL